LEEYIPKINDRFKILQNSVNQNIYKMKLKNFLQIDVSKRIKYFESFFKNVKSYSHENKHIDAFEDIQMGRLIETVIKDIKVEDGVCCLNSHIAKALKKMIVIQSGK